LQNLVNFTEALQFFALRAAKHAFFSGGTYKTDVLQVPQIAKKLHPYMG
jgi:hypothetical protein